VSGEEDCGLREACRRARPLVHEWIDRTLDEVDLTWLESHLSACPDCAAFAREIERVHDTLADLPEVPFPDAALREVWSRTADAERWWKSWWPPSPIPAAVAAIALAAALLWVTLDARRTFAPERPSERELVQALAETRYALALASSAIRRSEQAALVEVLRKEVAPALDRIPVRWPSVETSRRNGT
jgi:anti-sigma factor RsiW